MFKFFLEKIVIFKKNYKKSNYIYVNTYLLLHLEIQIFDDLMLQWKIVYHL